MSIRTRELTEGSQQYHLLLDHQHHGQMMAYKPIPAKTIAHQNEFMRIKLHLFPLFFWAGGRDEDVHSLVAMA